MPLRTVAAILLTYCAVSVAAAAAQPQVTVELGSREVYEGQSVLYRISVQYSDSAAEPTVTGNEDFEIVSLGSQSLSSQRIEINNGRRSAVSDLRQVHNYRLTPKRTGTITIPAPTAQADGRKVTGRAVTLKVLPAAAQDVAILEIRSDRPVVYPTQPFTVTLSVALKALPPPHAQRDPLSVLPTAPKLKIPWITTEPPSDAPVPSVEWRQWLSRLQDRHGFAIDGVVGDGLFPVFPTFRPRAVQSTRRDASGQEASYWVYEFSQKFTPNKIGAQTFGPVTLEGTLAAQSDEPPGIAGKQIYAVGKSLVVTVQDVPNDGRPESYVGAVGQFRVEADLVPKQAKVGDPLTLTLTLSGRGSLLAVAPPDLAQTPAIAKRFKIYEATQQIERETCRFTYALRPLAEGQEPFPSVPVSYFDPDAAKFATIQTQPLPLTILKADRLSNDQILATSGLRGRTAKELETRLEGIFANIGDPAAVADESIRPLRWMTGLGGLAGVYVALCVMVGWARRRRNDPALVRRRGAVSKARVALHRAATAARAAQTLAAANLVQDALVGLVADVANLPAAGLTPKEVAEQLDRFGISAALVDRTRRLLESCDAARYGALSGEADGLTREAAAVLDELTRALKTQKRFR